MSAPLDGEALARAAFAAIDRDRLAREIGQLVAAATPAPVSQSKPAPSVPPPASAAPRSQPASARHDAGTNSVLAKLVLDDLLDDAILGARPADKEYPLRLALGELGMRLEEDDALAFAGALNLYFRADMDEEQAVRVGFEASRAWYRFARAAGLEPQLVRQASPLLAALLTSRVARVTFSSVDHLTTFDSQIHEREPGADGTSGAGGATATSFAVKVAGSGMVRMKARVRS
jgi:hypothetical protein